MQLFYIPDITGDVAVMNPQESHHCLKVLRMVRGDRIRFVDGTGGYFEGTITDDKAGICRVEITRRTLNFEKRTYSLHVAIAPTKNQDRFEWFAEKATEIGIDTITPVICRHSERRKMRRDRLENILISAMKQSLKAVKPVLNELTTLEAFLEGDFGGTNCFIAHCGEEQGRKELLTASHTSSSFLVLIGPEGDFTPEEVERSMTRGFAPVTLGASRLRTETAGVVAAQIIADKMTMEAR